MRKILLYLNCLIFLSCKQFDSETKVVLMKKCVINKVDYEGFHSTIEPDPRWKITTDCGFSFITKDRFKYKLGDTVTYYIKTVENEKVN